LQPFAQKQNFIAWLYRIARSEWVVYAKPPFGGPHQVLKYLARYTHRVAIANQRLVALQDGHVSFRWKDYTHASQPAIMTLQATEFIRRFMLHVLPRGFVKIRHFGFLANRGREDHIRLCRTLLRKMHFHGRSALVKIDHSLFEFRHSTSDRGSTHASTLCVPAKAYVCPARWA
jgi:hypothetical protein